LQDVRLQSRRRIASPHLGVVSVIASVTALGYIRILGQQGDWPAIDARQTVILTLLIAFGILGVIGTFARSVTVRAATAAACASGLLPLGVLALFSIGLLLVVAGALAVVAWLSLGGAARRGQILVVSIASAFAVLAILVAGLAVTG
jgi:hypothetical protein